MPLTPINQGDKVLSKPLQDNFTYLDGRITDSNTSINSTINSMQASMASTTANLNNRISAVNSKVSINYTQLSPSGTINLTTNSLNTITPTGAVTFVLPDVASSTELNQILVQVNLTTVYSINVGTTHYFNGKSPQMSSIGMYDLIYEYDEKNDYWVVGWMRKS